MNIDFEKWSVSSIWKISNLIYKFNDVENDLRNSFVEMIYLNLFVKKLKCELVKSFLRFDFFWHNHDFDFDSGLNLICKCWQYFWKWRLKYVRFFPMQIVSAFRFLIWTWSRFRFWLEFINVTCHDFDFDSGFILCSFRLHCTTHWQTENYWHFEQQVHLFCHKQRRHIFQIQQNSI